MPQKTVYRARNIAEATIVKSILDDAGIKSQLLNDSLRSALGELTNNEASAPQLVVDEAHYDEARQLVRDYEVSLQSDVEPDITDIEGQFDWPICPDCDELREMTCPACDYSGPEFTEFAEGSQEEDEASAMDSDFPIMICSRCQHKTALSLNPTCRFCKHEFSRPSDGSEHLSHLENTNFSRVGFLLIALTVTAAMILAWMIYTFRS